MSHPLRITVLISGSGSNLQALVDATDSGRLPIEIVHVISNMADAGGLERAKKAGIATSVLPHQAFEERIEFDRALSILIAANQPDLVVLAGFMRIIGEPVLHAFEGRMINLHPSLLPLYKGTRTYQRALDSGDRQHGASIHFVTGELDGGPVLAQAVIPIHSDDSVETLQKRLAPVEHELIVASVELLANHRVECQDSQIMIDGRVLQQPLQMTEESRFATSD